MAKGRICLHGALLGLVLLFYFSLLVSGNKTDPQEVIALKAVRRKLKDPFKNLWNWKKKTDPCEPTKEWNGVICTKEDNHNAYFHVQQLRLMNMNLSGELSSHLGQISELIILDFMWNYITGSIPKEIGNLKKLQFLLLNGNQLSGPLADELGNLSSLFMFQVDQNQIEGPIPKSLANLPNIKHFHMSNNLFNGQIPPELSQLKSILHILFDNNKLLGSLPPELANIKTLRILQLDNNNFSGTKIPDSYGTMPDLKKLTLKNCNLQGNVPDFSSIPGLLYLDLSSNYLDGIIPTNKQPINITTIDLSGNMLIGSIPSNLSGLPRLQRLSLEKNRLTGDVPSTIWENMTFSAAGKLILNFEKNFLSKISGSLDPPSNVTIGLQGNPVYSNARELNIAQFCGHELGDLVEPPGNSSKSTDGCKHQSCPTEYESVRDSSGSCFCAAPLGVWFRLRSPSMSHFTPFIGQFKDYMTSKLEMDLYQLDVGNFIWQTDGKLLMFLKFFPPNRTNFSKFSEGEIKNLASKFYSQKLPLFNLFGPYDLVNFTFIGPYENVIIVKFPGSGMSKGLLAGIIIGAFSCGVVLIMAIIFIFNKTHPGVLQRKASKYKPIAKKSVKFHGVKGFNFSELETATDSFSITALVGQGGYGKVYKGILADGTIVAIKRAQQGSLQGENEFYTEIEMLSRLHHRNLVSLVGYCDEEGEQILVYEFMPNGSLHSLLSDRFRSPLSFALRLRIAMDVAKGILYLHTEADPPIIHRDIKANNVLLDSKFTAKVSDFGISKLAPVTDAKGFKIDQISTDVKGTPGYLDPEYFFYNKLTEKSDVYSLGIVFLELLTGMPPISHGRNIVCEVLGACQSGKMFSIVDRNMGAYTPECLKKFMDLAVKCSEDEASARPSMLEVVRELESITSMVPESVSLPSEVDGSSSGASGSYEPTPLYAQRDSYISSNYLNGSDLVSGAIPTIKPR